VLAHIKNRVFNKIQFNPRSEDLPYVTRYDEKHKVVPYSTAIGNHFQNLVENQYLNRSDHKSNENSVAGKH